MSAQLTCDDYLRADALYRETHDETELLSKLRPWDSLQSIEEHNEWCKTASIDPYRMAHVLLPRVVFDHVEPMTLHSAGVICLPRTRDWLYDTLLKKATDGGVELGDIWSIIHRGYFRDSDIQESTDHEWLRIARIIELSNKRHLGNYQSMLRGNWTATLTMHPPHPMPTLQDLVDAYSGKDVQRLDRGPKPELTDKERQEVIKNHDYGAFGWSSHPWGNHGSASDPSSE